MATSSIRALTRKLPLRPSIRLFATSSQPQPTTDPLSVPPQGEGAPGSERTDRSNPRSERGHRNKDGPDIGYPTPRPKSTKWSSSNKLPGKASNARSAPNKVSQKLAQVQPEEIPPEDEDWSLSIDEAMEGFGFDEVELKPPVVKAKEKDNNQKPSEKDKKLKEKEEKKKSKENEQEEKPTETKKKKKKKKKPKTTEEAAAQTPTAEDPVINETTESNSTSNIAPITSILDFGLPNRSGSNPPANGQPSKLPTITSAASSDEVPLKDTNELSLDDLFRHYERAFDAGLHTGSDKTTSDLPDPQDDVFRRRAVPRGTRQQDDSPVEELSEEKAYEEETLEAEEEDIKMRGNAKAGMWDDLRVDTEMNTEQETVAKGISSEHIADWLDRLEIRRAERRKKKEEARSEAEVNAWSSEGGGLNTSIIFSQSAQDPSLVDLVWENHDNYIPTQRHARSSSPEPETVLGRRIGDPNQLLSALSNGRNEYHYSLENLRLMRQGMEVAGLHERLRRTKLPFQFPAIKYEDIENIFRSRLPVGAETAYEPFPLIVPQESAVENPFLYRLIEENSKFLAIYGDVKSCQGYHPAPSEFFNNFILRFYGYLKPTAIITDANYRQPYSRQQTILSFMGIPTMVLLTIPSLPHAEPLDPRNLLAQLIAETFSCHYYNREIMRAQAPVTGLLHYNAQLWVVLYDPVADIPYVSNPINADLDIPPSHEEIEKLDYLSRVTNDAFTCAVVNGLEAMRNRERQEGDTDTGADWLDACDGMWAVLEARRMMHINYYGRNDLTARTYVTTQMEMVRSRHDAIAALDSVPEKFKVPIGTSADGWWMLTQRPTFTEQREAVKKVYQPPRRGGKGKKSPPKGPKKPVQTDGNGMSEYEYLLR
ncbi:hypothetical protein TWF481_011250 [Arthrobotrys musiformis]|uniref:Uncharacterized protein n=1 Tax=Arthrobotrys musiformis TaxID=47236 RepID=A0AAV9VYW9_9PEZI